MRKLRRLALALIATLAAAGWPGASAALVLPAANCPVNCLVFGDFTVYSLALLNGIAKPGDFVPTTPSGVNADPFNVQSGIGQISGGVVFGTGASGNPVNENFAGMDDAFSTTSGSGTFFSTTLAGDPPTLGTTNPFDATGDLATTWDASVSALRSFLQSGGGALVPFFNLNETGTVGLLGIDLLIWVRASLQDTDGVLPQKDYFLTADEALSMSSGGPDPTAATPESDTRWVYVHGTICVNGTTFLHLGPCTGADPAGSQNVDQNLGANNAAFAIFNEELSDLVLAPGSGYEFLHVEWRMSRLNNGFEQAFLLADTTVTQVPEPGMLWIWGVLLVALGAFSRRRTQH